MDLDKFLESDPLNNNTDAPPKDGLDKYEEQETVRYRANVTKAVEESPEKTGEIESLSKRYLRPTGFIERNIDSFRTQAKKDDFEKFRKDNPIAAARALDTNKLGVIQDDFDKLSKIESLSKRYKFAKEEPTVAGAFGSGMSNLKTDLSLFKAMQTGDPEDFAAFSEGQKSMSGYQERFNDYYSGYIKEMQKEGQEAVQAKDKLFRVWDRDAKGETLQKLADLADSGIDYAKEGIIDTAITAFSNPGATFLSAVQSSPNSFAPWAVAIPAAVAGAKVGGVAGGAVANVPGALLGASLGSLGGLVAGRLSSGMAMEYMGSIKEQLQSEGYDLTNPEQVQKAFNNPEFIEEVKAGAIRKGLTVAGVETLLEFVGGKIIAGAAKAPGVSGKIAGAAGGFATEAVGEGAGAALGEAAQAGDIREIDIAQGTQEGIAALFMAGGGQALAFGAYGATTSAQKIQEVALESRDAGDFSNSLIETVEAVNESSTAGRDPELVADILNSTSEGQAVYFQAEEFKNHWENLGESAVDKADELLPGGRASLNQGLEEGGTLKVSLGDFATKFGSEESFKELAGLARRRPEAINSLEANSYMGQLGGLLKEVSKQAKEELRKASEDQDKLIAVQNDIEGQLLSTGMNSKDAKRVAQLSGSFFNAVGQRALGEDAVDFYRRKTLEIQGFEDMDQVNQEGVLFQDDRTGLALREGETIAPSFNEQSSFKITEVKPTTRASAQIDKIGSVRERTKELLKTYTGNTVLGPVKFADEAVTTFFDRLEGRTVREGRIRTVARSKAKFVASMDGLKSVGRLLDNAVHMTTQADGTQSLYSVARSGESLLGLKFDIKDGLVQDMEIMSEQISEGAARRETPEGETSDTAPSNISIDQFKKLVNTGRRQDKVFFQDDQNQKVINRVNQDPLGFYSKVRQEIEAMNFKAMPAKDLASRIKKTQGIKQDELEFTGLVELLESTEGKIAKEDVLTFLDEGGVKFEEVVLGEGDQGEALRQEDATKYSQYTLPGGENYREVLLTLPTTEETEYTSSHWNETNVLAHMRLKDYTDADGKKTLLIEEIQSDWHQEGRKKGYGQAEQLTELPEGYKVEEYNKPGTIDYYFNVTSPEGRSILRAADTEAEARERALAKINREANEGTVPDAPFKSTEAWSLLAFKRVLRMAAEQGYDSVAWTPGEAQAERYDLSKQISKVVYMKNPSGLYTMAAEDLNGRNIYNSRKLTPEDMEGVIGKELTQKIVDDEGTTVKDTEGGETGFSEITGNGLKVGGEGMIGFYDKMLPKTVEKYMKKLDKKAKVGVGSLDTEDTTQQVWTVPVTDKVVEKVLQGQPLFQKDGKGARGFTDLTKPERILLGLLDNANKSTALHELGHVFLEYMKIANTEMSKLDQAALNPEQQRFAQDVETILDTLGVNSLEDIKTEHHEQWARLFEGYLMEGKAPSERLRSAFNAFKTWLVNIYRSMRGLEDAGQMTLNLSDDMRKVFDRMLATEDEINDANRDSGYTKEFIETMFEGLTANEAELVKLYNAHEDAKQDAEVELYKKKLESLKREKSREYKQAKKELKKKYTREKDNNHLYSTMETMRRGYPIDTEASDMIDTIVEDGGLYLKDLESFVSKEDIKTLSKIEGLAYQEVKEEKPKTYASLIRSYGGIKASSLSKDQIRVLKENRVYQVYFKNKGQPIDTLTDQLEADNIISIPEDMNGPDYLFQLLASGESLPTATQEQSAPANLDDILIDYNVPSVQILIKRLLAHVNPEKAPAIKFKTDQVKQVLGEDFENFPKYLYSSEGLDIQEVAEMFLHTSGATLIEQISNSPSPSKFVELSVQRDLDIQFPDFQNDMQAVKLEALDEVDKPDTRRQALKLELDIMLKNSPSEIKKIFSKMIKRLQSNKEVKASAKARINSTTYREATPAQFRILENRARNNKAQAVIAGDFEKGIREATREITAHEMVKTSIENKQKIEKAIDLNKQRLGRKSDKDLAKIGSLDMMKVAQTILASYGVLTDVQTDKLEVYLSQLQKYDELAFNKVSGLTQALLSVEPMNYKDLKVGDLNDVLDTVDAIYNLAKEEKQITVDGLKVDRDLAITDLITSLSRQDAKAIKREDSKWDRFKGAVSSIDAIMTRLEHLIGFLDGGDITGSFRKYLWNRANDAQTNYELELVNQFKSINDIIKTHFKGLINDSTTLSLSKYFPGASTANSSIKKSELVMALMHSGNDSNKRKLLLGRGWGIETMDGQLDSTQYDAFIQDMIAQGVITKDIMDGVQKVWDLFEDIKPNIQKTHKAVYGYFFNEIEANPIETPFGTYRGGYTPAITDPLMVEKEASRQNQASTEMDANTYAFASTPKGFTKERVDAYNKALSLDFGLIRGHVEKAVRFYTIEEAVQDLNKLFKSNDLTDTLFEVNNNWNNELFQPWIARLATQRTTTPADSKGGRYFLGGVNFLRSSANAQLMFLNVKNTLENLTDFPVLLAKVNRKHLMHGVRQLISNPKEAANFIAENSKDMKLRMEGQIFEINDAYRDMVRSAEGVEGMFYSLQDNLRKHTYILQQALQNQMETAGWMGSYNQAISEGRDHATAVREADSTIRTVMGSNRPIDMAKVETGNALQRVILTFYSYFLNKGNLARHAPKGKKLEGYAMAIMTPAILSAIFRKSFEDSWDEEEDGYVDDVADVLLMSQVRFAAATIPMGGTLSRFVEGQFNDKPYDDKLSISPLIGMVESSKGVVNLMTKDEIKGRDIRDTMNFFGTFTGVPVGAFGRPIGFLIDLEQGKQSANNPVDYARGIVSGRSGKK